MKCREIRPWRKRFRGAKRYYARLHEDAARFSFPLGEDHWYCLHHTHFDWDGHSRRGDWHHREHLRALFTAFRGALAAARASGRPVQIWGLISPAFWSDGHALYIHTPNPRGEAFPHAFNGIEWDAKPPAFLREHVADETWEIGASEYEGNRWFIVRERQTSS